jgi:exodeoxyribonuclease V beta subunit
VVDWKSNHLGHSPAHYSSASLDQAMQQHGYALQGLLYAAALHLLLQKRLPGYRHAQHFGSVMFLFVRGVRAEWPAGSGVVPLRPTEAVLQRLCSMFAGAA